MPTQSKLTALKPYQNRQRFANIFFCASFAIMSVFILSYFQMTKSQDRVKFLELFGFQLDPNQIVEKFPDLSYLIGFHTVDHLRYTSCPIYKNMHSVLETINCYLQPDKLKKNVFDLNLTDPRLWTPKPCLIRPPDFRAQFSHFDEKNWTRLVLVRHPISRFLSGWFHFW